MLIIHKYRPGKAIFAYFYPKNHTKPQNKNEHQKGLSEKQTGMQGYIYRLGGKCSGEIRRIPLRRFQPMGGKIPALEEKQSRRLFRIPYATPGQIPVQVQRRRTVLDQRRCRRCLSLECLRQRQFADRIINSPQLLFFIAPEVPGRCFYFQTSPVTNNTVNTPPPPAVPRRNSCIFCPDPNVSCSLPWRICDAEVTFCRRTGKCDPEA